jgi:hypothetical protein
MKLILPGVGWAIVHGHLLWTNNNGALWTDITPADLATQVAFDIFSLDAAHTWIVVGEAPGGPATTSSVHLLRTQDAGQNWKSISFDMTSYEKLKNQAVIPLSLWFVDPQHGWFLWKVQTGTAFSKGKLFATEDGGETWAERPDPPSAQYMRFHTQYDGWTTGGAASNELWVTNDGGSSWQQKSVPVSSACQQCRLVYGAPRFEDPYNGVLSVAFIDDSSPEPHRIQSTLITRDGGSSWQISEEYEQKDLEAKSPLVSLYNMKSTRVFSSPRSGIKVQYGVTTASSPFPKELPPRGAIVSSGFTDEMNGWLIYQGHRCNKFRNRATDGPGLPCLDGVLQSDLLSTSDGGKTFQVITPGSSVLSQ